MPAPAHFRNENEAMHDPKKLRGRFEIERDCDGWTLADYAYGTCLSFDTRREAEEAKRFARAYAKRWGDVDFDSFPYSLTEPLEKESA